MVRMNNSPKELTSTQKQAAETLSGNRLSDALESAEERPAAPGQNSVQAAHRIDMNSNKPLVGTHSYTGIEADFRSHHQTNAAQHNGPYEHYRLVYRYGYDLGTDTRYRDAAWIDVEQVARPRWEERNPDTWEQFKEMIQYAWDTARLARR